jgi:hypothetical protein
MKRFMMVRQRENDALGLLYMSSNCARSHTIIPHTSFVTITVIVRLITTTNYGNVSFCLFDFIYSLELFYFALQVQIFPNLVARVCWISPFIHVLQSHAGQKAGTTIWLWNKRFLGKEKLGNLLRSDVC